MDRKDLTHLLNGSLSFFIALEEKDKETVINACVIKKYKSGSIMLKGGSECAGLVIVKSGQIRAYTVSEDGKEITLYRLLDGDTCIMSAGCMLKDLNFVVSLSVEADSEVIILPTNIYETINEKYITVKNFTLNLVSSRFSDVMWVLQQYVFLGMAKRLANALLEQSVLIGSLELNITHEELARDLGSAREVITRLLNNFSEDGIVRLSRGKILIINKNALSVL